VEDEAYISIAPFFFESINLPYTGCRADSIYHTHNKLIFKRFLKFISFQKNILTPRYVTAKDLSEFVPDKKYILKPTDRHSSISIDENSVKYFQNAKDIKREILDRQKKYNFDFYAEEYIEGREFNISLLNGKILPRAEIIFKDYKEDVPKIVCYKSKWDESSFEYKNTIRSFDRKIEDQKLFDDMDDVIIFLSRVLSIKTYARFDFRIDKNGNCYLLEINANPCLNDDSGFYAAANRGGLSYDEMVSAIIKSSLKSYL
jgi:D-alanine-D-alanine ligase